MASDQQPSTQQILGKIPNYPSPFRHRLNGNYYGIKKVSGKRKEHSLKTTDRKIAELKLASWIKSLDKVDANADKITLAQLLEKSVASRR
jgi:hypothetical protein